MKPRMTYEEATTWIGLKVTKHSGKPFKSRLKVNTVVGVVASKNPKGSCAFTFAEDDSSVECDTCKLV